MNREDPEDHHRDHLNGNYSAPRLPLELCEAVIDAVALHAQPHASNMYYSLLGSKLARGRATLVACAFVCKAWHARCLVHLLSSVWISDRQQVVALSRRLRERSAHRTLVKDIVINGFRGSLVLRLHNAIAHFGTLATMCVRQLPRVTSLNILQAHWELGLVHADITKYLPSFSTIVHLRLINVLFTAASQFATLLSALPHIQYLFCSGVACRQWQYITMVPSSHSELREVVLRDVAEPLIDALAKLSSGSPKMGTLSYGASMSTHHALPIGPGQRLLEAYGAMLRDVEVEHPEVPANPCVNLSLQTNLVRLSLTYPFGTARTKAIHPDFASVYATLATITSQTLSHVCVCFVQSYDYLDDLDDCAPGFLEHIEQSDALQRIDEVLSRIFNPDTPKGLVRFELRMLHTLYERVADANDNCWARLITAKMPRLAARGILECVLTIWERNDVERRPQLWAN